MNEENKTVTKPLNITPNTTGAEVGTIEDALKVDSSIEPITAPPVVSDEEAETYKNLEERLVSAPDELDWETEAIERSTEATMTEGEEPNPDEIPPISEYEDRL
jgi:hypothetical protein